MGFVFSGMTGGFLLSPFLAGIVYAKAGYFPVFAMVIAVLTADLLLRAAMIEKRIAKQWDKPRRSSSEGPTDSVEESVASEQGNGTTVKGRPLDGSSQTAMPPDEHSSLLHKNTWRNADSDPNAALARQWKSKSQTSESWFMRHFPSTTIIFRSKRLMTAVLGIFIYMTITASFDGALAQFVKRTFDFGSSEVGLIFLALTTPALFGTAYGALSDRYGPRNVALTGFAVAALGLALSVVITHKSTAQIAGLSTLLVLIGKQDNLSFQMNVTLMIPGTGVDLILTPLSADMFYEAAILEEKNPDVFGEAGSYAQVYSLLCAALGFATAVGPAWTGFMYEQTNWGVTMLTLVLICLLGSIPVFLYTGGRQEKVIALADDDQA